jgi:hypothetical protein
MDRDVGAKKEKTTENKLLNSENQAGTDWFTTLATIERAKTLRRETQEARKGKPITFSGTGRWSPSG